jgi:N-acetylmuramoyl-L-alanine amidase
LKSRPFPVFAAAAALAAVSLALPFQRLHGQASGSAISVLTREGRRPLPLTLVNDQEFIALDDLAGIFSLSVQESLGAVTVSYKGKTIILTPDQTLASVAGRLISLPAPPSRAGRRWLVPVEFVSRALAPIYDARLELRKPSHLVIVGDLRVPRLAVRYEAVGAGGRLTVDATPRAAGTISQDNEHVTVKFEADALDLPTPLVPPLPAGSLVQAVRVVDAVTIGFDLIPRTGGIKATSQPVGNTARLIVDIVPPQTETSPPSAATPAQPAAPPELPPAFNAPASTVRTITIDPGHGGEDEGVKGAAGTKEKDLALTLARRARAVLEARLGVRVLLTRDEDRDLPIDERPAIANNNKADLFVSLHANASMRRAAAGLTIYCAEFDKGASDATGTRHPERVPAFGGGLRDIEMVPWDLAQTRHLDQSIAFAEMLQQQLQGKVPLGSHPRSQAPLRVLESANMPAVLIEVGYLSNPEQEKLIAGEPFQNTVVQAIYDAVVRYRDSLQNGGTH